LSDSDLVLSISSLEASFSNYSDQKSQLSLGFKSENDSAKRRIETLQGKIDYLNKSSQKELFRLYIENMEEEIGKLQSQIAVSRNSERQRLSQAAADLVKNIDLSVASIEKFLRSKEILAPVDGIVARVDGEAGALVTAGRPIFTIVPPESKYIANIRVGSKDIVRIRKGQKIYMRLEAYPHQIYGQFSGHVLSFDEIRSSGIVDGYIVKADLEVPEGLDSSIREKIRYVGGMKLQAYIVTDRKRLIKEMQGKLFGGGSPE